jgi:hypothetical protein
MRSRLPRRLHPRFLLRRLDLVRHWLGHLKSKPPRPEINSSLIFFLF